jgi:hypothetical protein
MDWSNNLEFEQAMTMAQKTNVSFFLTGKAGTGKSQFINELIGNTPNKQFIKLAPTGIAAVNIGGVTIHSFCRFPHRPMVPGDHDIKIFYDQKEKIQLIKTIDTIIIDEVSMLRADIVEGIDLLLKKNTGNYHLTFGGKQIIFVGDLFQLSPVIKMNTVEGEILKEFYETPYFFSSPSLKEIELPVIELTKSYRQRDPEFQRLLDNVRLADTSEQDILKFNERVVSNNQEKQISDLITLTTTNSNAEVINNNKLDKLKDKKIIFISSVEGEFSANQFPAPEELTLKVGAQVMFLKNDVKKINQEQRYFNGSIGNVTELSNRSITVTMENGNKINVERDEWQNIEYKIDSNTKKVTSKILGTFKQFPIKLAWAITIHKSQGLTFDKALIDLSTGTFSSGQVYVALSRVRSFEGLFLKNPISENDIKIDTNVIQFSRKFNNQDEIQNSINHGREIYVFEKKGDLENAGLFLLSNSILELKNKRPSEALKNLKKGYSLVSCDCAFRKELRYDKNEIFESFTHPEVMMSKEATFLLAIVEILTAIESVEIQRSIHRLELIDEEQKLSELYYYFKGRVLTEAKEYNLALDVYQQGVKKYPRSSKIWYRIGRLKSNDIKINGIDELINSIVRNPSSACVHRILRQNSQAFGGRINRDITNEFVNAFNSSEAHIFIMIKNFYSDELNAQSTSQIEAMNVYIDTFRNEQIINTRLINEDDFVDISDDMLLSLYEDEIEEFDFDDDDDDFYENYYDEGPSYSRYGGAYGFDDDTIDSAFEGNPENYWNID